MPAPESSYTLFNDPEDIATKAAMLIALVGLGPLEPLPAASGEAGPWRTVFGPAMLSKAAGTLDSMMVLMPTRRSVDAMTLLRTLFENAVVMSWLAIDPRVRLEMFYRTSYYYELEEHKDWKKAGRGLRTQEEAAELKKRSGIRPERLPGVPTMAANADEHWGTLIPGWSPSSAADHPGVFSSLRGLYRYIFHRGSSAAHSRARGLDPFATFDESGARWHPEAPGSDLHVYELGLHCLAFAIMASEQTLGWPSWRQAARILGREEDVFGT